MAIENGSTGINHDEQGNEEQKGGESDEEEESDAEVCCPLINCSPAIEWCGVEAENGEGSEAIHGEEVWNINEDRWQEGVANVMAAAEIDDAIGFFAGAWVGLENEINRLIVL